jgi:hypothetical protein
MSDWLRIFKHLLPTGLAWQITVDKPLRRLFQGFTQSNEDIKGFADDIYSDLNPQVTRFLSFWEEQFALPGTQLTEQERRNRLGATWKALGGQSPKYIQDTLQAAGFEVYVHEWWEPSVEHPTGGSVNGDVTPVARDPFTYLSDGVTAARFLMVDGGADSQDGDPISQEGATSAPVGYPLVNKVFEVSVELIGDGSPGMQDGSLFAQDGGELTAFIRKQYVMPADPTKYPYFLYIGGETFPEQATVPLSRKDEFEDLCLKICPLEQWLGILVNFS